MKIFKEGNNIRFQLMDTVANRMLFDFTIPAHAYDDLKNHMIEHLTKGAE